MSVAYRQMKRLHKAIQDASSNARSSIIRNGQTTLNAILDCHGRNSGGTPIRKAKEFLKRPTLMCWIKYLSRSPVFNESWTANTFRSLAEWDFTVCIFQKYCISEY